MMTFFQSRLSGLVLLVIVGTTVGLTGCGQKATNSASEAAAFAGDPAVKAKMGASMRAKAEQNRAQFENRSRQAAAQAQANAQKGPPAVVPPAAQ